MACEKLCSANMPEYRLTCIVLKLHKSMFHGLENHGGTGKGLRE